MTKLDIKGATDRLASMRGVDIVGANNNLQEGKNLLTLAPGMLFVTIFESFDLSKTYYGLEVLGFCLDFL